MPWMKARKAERSRTQAQVVTSIRKDLAQVAGVESSMLVGFNDEKQIMLQLRGDDAATLAQLADRILNEVRQVPGAVDTGLSTKGQKPELNVQIDRALAGSLGVTIGQVAQALRPAFAGIDVGEVASDGRLRRITGFFGELPEA